MIDVKECDVNLSQYYSNCYVSYKKNDIIYVIKHDVLFKTGYTYPKYWITSTDRWSFTIQYKSQTRNYSTDPFYRMRHKIYGWDKIPKKRKQIAEDLKEIYTNTILIIKRLEE